MKSSREQAKTVLGILKKIDDGFLKKELVLLFLPPYALYAKERVSGQEAGLIEKIIKFLQDIAEGKVVIGKETELIGSIPDLASLVDELERAQREGPLEGAQIRKALLRAFLAQKRKEQAAQYAPPVSPELPIRKPLRMVPSETQKEPEAQKKEEAKKEKIRDQLLIRISYKKSSVLGLIAQELSKIPGELPQAVFGGPRRETIPILANYGVGPEKLRLALENFRLQNPKLDENHPILRLLGETLGALADYGSQHPRAEEVIKTHQNEIDVGLSLTSESEKEMPSSNSRVFLRAVVGTDKGGIPKLFIAPPVKKEVGTQAVSVLEATKQAFVPKNVFSGVFVSLKKLLALPTSLLTKLRGYLGGALIAAGVALPLPAGLRAAAVSLGFWLAWREIKRLVQNVIPAVTRPLRSVPFLLFLSRGINNILGQLYTKPTLSWLRTSLVTGFGLGAFFLPVPFPVRALFLVFGGSLGLAQAAHSFDGITSASLGLARAGERLAFALSDTRDPRRFWLLILGALLIAVLGPALFSYINIHQAQGTFLTAGGAPVPESRFIQVTTAASPQNIRNEDLPKRVDFTIVVTAKEQALTIVSVKETFAAITKDKTITIPEKILTAPKTRLAPAESTEIKFSLELDRNFEDSAITATTTISASVDGHPATQTTGASTTVIVGSPPTSCFAFLGNWNEAEKNRAMAAIAFVSKSQAFTTRLCAGAGTISLMRGTGRDWSGEVNNRKEITLFDRAFNAPYQPAHLYYTLAHESGHVYGNHNGAVFSVFLQEVTEPFLATYSREKNRGEDFAETIGMFIAWRQLPSPFTGVNLPTLWGTYPQHYRFAKNHIFTDGVEY